MKDIEKILKQLEEIQLKWGIDPSDRFEIEGLSPSNKFFKDKEKFYEDILLEETKDPKLDCAPRARHFSLDF